MPQRKLLHLTRKRPSRAPNHSYLELESNLGSQLFGPLPEGVDRKFFHSIQKNVWIWHENDTTIRYEVRPHGVFKRINAAPYTKLTGPELANFRTATRTYLTALRTHLYK